LDVLAGDGDVAVLVLVAQPVDQLGPQDVDLAVQDAPLVGDLGLLLGELSDDVFEFDVRQRAKVGERLVHRALLSRALPRPTPVENAGSAGHRPV
jgi:hypothetical protein